jgi:hypothetical protein
MGSFMKCKQSGFSVVRVLIVLAVIFFLANAFLACGCQRVDTKLHNVISDFNGVASAQYAYQDKFGALPGNDPSAAVRWPRAASGTGSGILRGTYNNSYETPQESNNYWQHLRLAGFVSGEGIGPHSQQQPTNAFGGTIGVQMGNGTGGVVMGSGGYADGFSGLIMCSAGIPAHVAIALDDQMDDGNGATGKMRAQRQTTPNPAIKAVLGPEDAYVEDGSSTYTVCKAM